MAEMTYPIVEKHKTNDASEPKYGPGHHSLVSCKISKEEILN